MAPLSKAIRVRPMASSENEQEYIGEADKEWGITTITMGGYLLALILEACIAYQSTTPHVDPIHLTTHFLRKTLPGPVTVRIKRVKTGSAFTNIAAELVQEDVVKISTHAIFGINDQNPKDKAQLTLNPPSRWARRHPLYSHPSQEKRKPFPRSWSFAHHIGWTEDKQITAKNQPDHPNRSNDSTVGGGGLEWGGWFEFKEDHISNPALAFLADVFENTPALLPRTERQGLSSPTWFATLALSIDFKNKISAPSAKHADRTVGLYSSGRFVTHPQGRHDIYVEIWTAPSNIGEGEPNDHWRDEQVCLAVATQVALCIPMGPNFENVAKL